MIAHGAKQAWLEVVKGHVIWKAAGVNFSVVMTARIAAVDEHVVAPMASHIRERHGLVVKQQVRDRPEHHVSPLARALFGKRIGDVVVVGNSEAEILKID